MDLHEYQARTLFERHGIPMPPAVLADTPEQAAHAARLLGSRVAVKAQVKTGGRGKAGGVKVVNGAEEAGSAASAMLGTRINTHVVSRVLVAQGEHVAAEYYSAVVLDRATRGYVALFCAAGGVDVEQAAHEHPDSFVRVGISPLVGIDEAKAQEIVTLAGLPPAEAAAIVPVLMALWETCRDEDATLVEVNPLATLADGSVVALDAKITLDDNARYRHPEWEGFAENGPADPLEVRAAERGLHYVRLEGHIGVIGNGAGLVMATLDSVAYAGAPYGLAPANFLDIGGGASASVMHDGLEIVLADPSVRSILVNVFGGITACDEVAAGILSAVDALGAVASKPIVVRLAGNAFTAGRRILKEAGRANIIFVDAMDDAAKQAVTLARSELARMAGSGGTAYNGSAVRDLIARSSGSGTTSAAGTQQE